MAGAEEEGLRRPNVVLRVFFELFCLYGIRRAILARENRWYFDGRVREGLLFLEEDFPFFLGLRR